MNFDLGRAIVHPPPACPHMGDTWVNSKRNRASSELPHAPFRAVAPTTREGHIRVGRGSNFPHHYRRKIMRWMTWAMCGLIHGTALVPAFARSAEEAQEKLQ